MGIIPLFNWGEINALFYYLKIQLNQKIIDLEQKYLKLFRYFKLFFIINMILIPYGFFNKKCSKPIIKYSKGASIEESRKEYKK